MSLEQQWAKAVLRRVERIDGITINGIRLAASEKDRSLFSQGLVLLREAEDLLPDEPTKAAFRASPQTIADAQGNTHTMSVTDLRALLVAYGAAYQALWTAAAATGD
jgi:hypothetical protein